MTPQIELATPGGCLDPRLGITDLGCTHTKSHIVFYLQNICYRHPYHLSGPWVHDNLGQYNSLRCNSLLRDHHSPSGAVLQCPWSALGVGAY